MSPDDEGRSEREREEAQSNDLMKRCQNICLLDLIFCCIRIGKI